VSEQAAAQSPSIELKASRRPPRSLAKRTLRYERKRPEIDPVAPRRSKFHHTRCGAGAARRRERSLPRHRPQPNASLQPPNSVFPQGNNKPEYHLSSFFILLLMVGIRVRDRGTRLLPDFSQLLQSIVPFSCVAKNTLFVQLTFGLANMTRHIDSPNYGVTTAFRRPITVARSAPESTSAWVR
jgi:hypothetical protein